MRHLLMLTTAAVLALSAPALAQSDKAAKTPADRAAHRTERMTRDLGLSAEQQAKVQDLNNQFASQVETMRPTEAERAERKARHEKARQARADYDEKLKAILTSEQFAKFQQTREDQREHAHERRMERGGKKLRKPMPDRQPVQPAQK